MLRCGIFDISRFMLKCREKASECCGKTIWWLGLCPGPHQGSLQCYFSQLTFYRKYSMQGSYGQGKSGNFEGVRESQGKQRVREKSGNFNKILLTRPIIYALFSQFLSASGGFAPRLSPGLPL